MAPKRHSDVKSNVRASGKGTKVVDGSEEVKGHFDPKSVSSKCRFFLNIPKNEVIDFDKKFIEFILYIRFCCSEGKRCILSKWLSKFICLEDEDYKEKFIILTLAIEMQYEIELLIYRPNVYMLAVCVEGNWWQVKDFLKHTKLNFPESKRLSYGSSYSPLPDKYNYHFFCQSIISLYKGNDCGMENTDTFFKTLCVIICESTRFDSVLYLLAPSLVDPLGPVVFLTGDHTWAIRHWETLSTLWYIYDLGYIWNPKGLLNLQIDDAVRVERVLGLLMHPPNACILKIVKECWEKEKEEKSLRTRAIGFAEMTVLEEIRQRYVSQNLAKRSEEKKMTLMDTKFLDDMRKKLEVEKVSTS